MPACWIEINLSAIRLNFRAIRDIVGPETDVIAVIKANAYGHGAVEVGRALAQEGAKYLAVTRVEEAIPLRQNGIDAPILLLSPAPAEDVPAVVEHKLTACISAFEDAQRLSQEASKQSTLAHAQLKINTGMSRLGVEPEEAVEVAKKICELPNLKLEAAWTHFADAAEHKPRQLDFQYGKFQPLVHHLSRAMDVSPRAFHCANSSALLRFPALRLSCVRTGTLLYGQFPSGSAAEAGAQLGLKLHDTFKAQARIVAIKDLRPGQKVGYGGEWTAERPSRVATITLGWADGLTMTPHPRAEAPHIAFGRSAKESAKHLKSWAGFGGEEAARRVRIRGEEAYIVGRIAMQSCSIEVSHLPNLEIGDIVTVPMRRTSAGAHLPRVYI